jgi:hypothetical protein
MAGAGLIGSPLSLCNDESFNRFLGSAVSPNAISPHTQEREDIRAAVILAEDLHWGIGRRFVRRELGDSLLSGCHVNQ